ncbi:hypothetical protein PAEH1_00945 [Paenalcaligenes hominis]|uniref:Uncharacterized protein n=1 Tax=Paenalcaligenes hominis TaxID=643674 RepID=A0A1U9JXI9_9BURK|nr:hypothetical protein [Paenalcaligenes hominis]AQS50461.1 hypothetical protein PAEH1_00945 [Paenalcaligenes hominis]
MTITRQGSNAGVWFQADEWEQLTGGLPIYRGFTRPLESETVHLKAPSNRPPKNIPKHDHHAIDAWFLEHFGAPFRSGALYGTGNFEKAVAHAEPDGEVALIRPNAEFTFCWSPLSYDLMGEYAQREASSDLIAFLEGLQFQQHDLEQAALSGHEIMLVSPSFTIERVLTI